MTIHFYDPKRYEYATKPHQELVRWWHKDLGLPFPPAHGTHYDDESRVIVQGSFTTLVKTPPPWVGKIERSET